MKDKTLYPKDWPEISARIKRLSSYRCDFCHKLPTPKNCLTVHHLDGDPKNSLDSNLVCLHASCHFLFHNVFKSCNTLFEYEEIKKNVNSQIDLFLKPEVIA